MTPAELHELCEAIFGPGWVSALARELVREPRTVRRWRSGESPVPKAVAEWLRKKHTTTTNERTPTHGQKESHG